ncbi:MAG TPA: hypothetical protein VF841_06715 [Anaeromyxobacter sp.]
MRGWRKGSLAAAVGAALALGGCAGARTGEGRSCAAAYDHADGVLRRTLARSVGPAAPGNLGATVEQERLRARMDAWSEQHRQDVVSECGSWAEEQYRCVLGAQSAQALAGCGLGDLVSSFTTDVLGSVAPLSPIIAPPP